MCEVGIRFVLSGPKGGEGTEYKGQEESALESTTERISKIRKQHKMGQIMQDCKPSC